MATEVSITRPDAFNERLRSLARTVAGTSKLRLGVAIGVSIVYVALALGWSLTKEPQGDEAWFASPALNLINKGHMGMSVLESGGMMDKHYYATMPLYYIAEAAWFKMIGFSLTRQRALSIVWGLVAMVSWFFIMKTLSGDRNVALLAFSLIGLDCIFIRTAAFARMDMMSAALGFAGYAVYLGLRERNFWVAILASQSLVALSGLTHPNGFLEFAGLLYLTLAFDRRRLRWRHLGIAAVPYLIGAAGWGLYILEDPSNFLYQIKLNGAHRWRGLLIWNNIKSEIMNRYLVTYGFGPENTGIRHFMILFLIVFVMGVVGALLTRGIRQHPGYRKLLVLLAIHCGLLSFINDYNPTEYMVHVVPLFAAVLSLSVCWWWSQRPAQAWAIGLGLCGFIFLQVSALMYRVIHSDYRNNYLPAVRFVKDNSDDKTFIMGDGILAYELGFRDNLVDDIGLGYWTKKRPDMIVVDHEYELQFDMIRGNNKALYSYIISTLENDYRKVYDNGEYKIYLARRRVLRSFVWSGERSVSSKAGCGGSI